MSFPDPNTVYIVPIPGFCNDKDIVRHTAVILRTAYDGGMYDFIDPVTGDVVGCCGRNWTQIPGNVRDINEWADEIAN